MVQSKVARFYDPPCSIVNRRRTVFLPVLFVNPQTVAETNGHGLQPDTGPTDV